MPRNQVTTDELHKFKTEQMAILRALHEERLAKGNTIDDIDRAYALGREAAIQEVLRLLEEIYMSPEPEHGNDLRDPRAKLRDRAERIKELNPKTAPPMHSFDEGGDLKPGMRTIKKGDVIGFAGSTREAGIQHDGDPSFQGTGMRPVNYKGRGA